MVQYYAGMTDTQDFTLPLASDQLSEAVVSYQQCGMTVLEKTTSTFYEIDSDSCYFLVELSQTDTLRFKDNEPMYVQVNIKLTSGQRMTSDMLKICVGTQAHREVI